MSKADSVHPIGLGEDLDQCLWEMLYKPNRSDYPRWVTSRRFTREHQGIARLTRLGLVEWDGVGDRRNVYARVTPAGKEWLRRLGYEIS